jgi:hypothetical protein
MDLDEHEQFHRADSEQAVIMFYQTQPSIESPNRWTIGPNLVVIPPMEFK